MMKQILVFLTTSVVISSSLAFAPASLASTKKVHSSSSLYFGIPTFGGGDKNDEEPEIEGLEKKQIGASGFLQLLTAGLGAPFLGDYQGVDKESGKFMFSLEANNLVDEVRYHIRIITQSLRNLFKFSLSSVWD